MPDIDLTTIGFRSDETGERSWSEAAATQDLPVGSVFKSKRNGDVVQTSDLLRPTEMGGRTFLSLKGTVIDSPDSARKGKAIEAPLSLNNPVVVELVSKGTAVEAEEAPPQPAPVLEQTDDLDPDLGDEEPAGGLTEGDQLPLDVEESVTEILRRLGDAATADSDGVVKVGKKGISNAITDAGLTYDAALVEQCATSLGWESIPHNYRLPGAPVPVPPRQCEQRQSEPEPAALVDDDLTAAIDNDPDPEDDVETPSSEPEPETTVKADNEDSDSRALSAPQGGGSESAGGKYPDGGSDASTGRVAETADVDENVLATLKRPPLTVAELTLLYDRQIVSKDEVRAELGFQPDQVVVELARLSAADILRAMGAAADAS